VPCSTWRATSSRYTAYMYKWIEMEGIIKLRYLLLQQYFKLQKYAY
jgi:hypothetical protein